MVVGAATLFQFFNLIKLRDSTALYTDRLCVEEFCRNELKSDELPEQDEIPFPYNTLYSFPGWTKRDCYDKICGDRAYGSHENPKINDFCINDIEIKKFKISHECIDVSQWLRNDLPFWQWLITVILLSRFNGMAKLYDDCSFEILDSSGIGKQWALHKSWNKGSFSNISTVISHYSSCARPIMYKLEKMDRFTLSNVFLKMFDMSCLELYRLSNSAIDGSCGLHIIGINGTQTGP